MEEPREGPKEELREGPKEKLREEPKEKLREEPKEIAEGITKGEQKAKKEIVFSMAEKELSVERIAELVKVSVQQVQEWLTGSPDPAR